MSKPFLCAVAVCVSVVFVSGCYQPPATADQQFTSNDLAKETLGDTCWSDPQGICQLQFDENAKQTDIVIPDLPEEFADLNVSGEPFTVTIPSCIEVIGGQTVTLAVNPTVTTIEDDGNGGYSLEFNFVGEVSGTELAALVDHVELVFSSTVSQDGRELSDLSGEITVVGPFDLQVFSTSIDVDQTVPLEQVL